MLFRSGIVGYATTTKVGGSLGVVGVRVQTTAGQINPNFAGAITAGTGLTVTSGTTSLGGALTVTSNGTFQGGTVTVGVPGSTTGNLVLANTSSSRNVIVQGLNPSGTGNATIQIPTIAGGSTDTVCLLTLANCAGPGGGVTGTGTADYVARFTGTSTLGTGVLGDTGTAAYVGASVLSGGGLFNVGTTKQFQVSSAGAVTAVGLDSGAGLIQGTGGATISGTSALSTLTASGTTTLGGATTINNTAYVNTNNASAFKVEQSGVHDNTLVVDTTNGLIGINGTTTAGYALSINGSTTISNNILAGGTVFANMYSISDTSVDAGSYSKGYIAGSTGVTAGDIVIENPSNGRPITTTTANDVRVLGVALTTAANLANTSVAIEGNTRVNALTATAVAVGDQLVTSTSAGFATVDNNATTGILGYATTAKSAGVAGQVGVRLQVHGGQASPNFAGSVNVQGGGLTLGVAGTTAGSLNLANTGSSRMVVLQGLNPSGTGNATIQIPTIAGGSTDTVCLVTLGNCAAAGGAIGGTGTAGYAARFTGTSMLGTGVLQDSGTAAYVSTSVGSGGGLFNVGTTNQFQVASTGAVTAVGLNSGSGLIQGTGGATITGTSALGILTTSSSATIGTTLNVTNATTTGGLVNNGSTLNVAQALGNLSSGAIGAAAATVDAYTAFTINPSAAGRTYTIPTPTTTTTGRVIYITNISASNSFTIGSVVFSPGSTAAYVWNGTASAWSFGSIDTGVTTVGVINTGGYSTNGATIVGNTIYLQSADATNGGILTSGTQTITGAKTFNTALTASLGFTASGAVTNINASSNFATNINTGSSTGAVNIGNASAGAISLQSTSTIGIGNNSTGAITIGGATQVGQITLGESSNNGNHVNIGTGTGSTNINIGTANTSGAIAIGTSLVNTSITIGGTAQTGNIIFGQSTATNTVRIGNGTISSGNTGTITIGTNATGTGKTAINIGSSNDASSVSLQSGTGGISLTGPTSITGATTINTSGSGATSIGNSSGGAVTLQSGSNALLIGGTTQAGTITLGSSSVSNTVNIGTGTGTTAINIGTNNTSGTIAIGTGIVNTSITIGGTAQTGDLTLGQSTTTNSVNIGTGTIASGFTGVVNIATNATGTGRTQTNIGSANGSSFVQLQGGSNTSGAVSLQVGTSSSIKIGTDGNANNIDIGNTSGAVLQAITLGANATASSSTSLTIGSTIGASYTTIQGGTGAGGILLKANGSASTGVMVKGLTDSTSALAVQNAAGTATVLDVDTTNARVGIGTATPGTRLHIYNNSNTSSGLRIENINTGSGSNTQLELLNSAIGFNVGLGATSNFFANKFYIYDTVAAVSRFTLDSSGSIGVGTNATAIGARFEIQAPTSGSATALNVNNSTGSGAIATFQDNGTSVFTIADNGAITHKNSTNSTAAFVVQNSSSGAILSVDTTNGFVGVAAAPATSVLTVGTATTTAAGGITFSTDTNLYRSAANELKTDGSLLAANRVVANSGSVTTKVAIGVDLTGATAASGIVFGASTYDIGIIRTGSGQLTAQGHSTSTTQFTVKGTAAQSTDLFRLQDSAGAILAVFQSDGKLAFGPTGSQDTNLYRAGANSLQTDDSFTLSLAGSGGGNAVCFTGGTNNVTGSKTLTDCSAAPAADYAEKYPVEAGAGYGDIMALGTESVTTYGETNGSVDWAKIKGHITKLGKSTAPYQSSSIGILSDNYSDFTSTGNNIKAEDNPMPVALNGRVPVNIAPGSPAIAIGDYITTSTVAGKGMKASSAGYAIGKALSAWDPSSGDTSVMVFVEPGYYAGPSATSVVQNGGNATLTGLTVSGTADFADLNVGGSATITNLQVQTIQVSGSLTVLGLTSVADLEINGHIITRGDTPLASVMAAAGTSATMAIDGNDTAGTVTITTGTAGIANGDLGKLTFKAAFSKAPKVILSAQDQASQQAQIFPGSKTTQDFTFKAGQALAPNTTYTFDYFIVE